MRSFRHSTTARVLFVMGLAALSAAPTPGDVGGCGQHPDPLDATAFFARKRTLDCLKCGECDVHTAFCGDACAATSVEPSFPTGCVPLVHDGEVCLNAIEAASCGDYEDYSRDEGRLSPSECQFCPELVP
jgi:hypothetical protein